jgi:hypothetical protein
LPSPFAHTLSNNKSQINNQKSLISNPRSGTPNPKQKKTNTRSGTTNKKHPLLTNVNAYGAYRHLFRIPTPISLFKFDQGDIWLEKGADIKVLKEQ